MPNPVVAFTEFADGVRRSVYEEPDGRQYVIDKDGEQVYGVWYIPREECDRPNYVFTLGGRDDFAQVRVR
jgi:hypothetical protein